MPATAQGDQNTSMPATAKAEEKQHIFLLAVVFGRKQHSLSGLIQLETAGNGIDGGRASVQSAYCKHPCILCTLTCCVCCTQQTHNNQADAQVAKTPLGCRGNSSLAHKHPQKFHDNTQRRCSSRRSSFNCLPPSELLSKLHSSRCHRCRLSPTVVTLLTKG
jgi:hypothetical protein